MGEDKQEKNNEEYAEGYSRGRSGDFIRDVANDILADDKNSQDYKGYTDGEADRKRYGYKDADDCGTGESEDKGGLCFITSACVEARGMQDDCPMLNDLRAFRDEYVAASLDGIELLREYYAMAPAIVVRINRSDSRRAEWERVFSELSDAVSDMRDGRPGDALAAYRRLYLRLKVSYLG